MDEEARLSGEMLTQALRTARELLGLQVAWVAELREGRKIFQTVEGDGASFGIVEGESCPIDATYCDRLLRGMIPGVIPDTHAEPAARGLDEAAGIRAYVGVPIQLSDGTLYGTICCAGHEPDHALSTRDLTFLRGVARRVAAELEARRLRPDGAGTA